MRCSLLEAHGGSRRDRDGSNPEDRDEVERRLKVDRDLIARVGDRVPFRLPVFDSKQTVACGLFPFESVWFSRYCSSVGVHHDACAQFTTATRAPAAASRCWSCQKLIAIPNWTIPATRSRRGKRTSANSTTA